MTTDKASVDASLPASVLAELEEALAAATPAPWKSFDESSMYADTPEGEWGHFHIGREQFETLAVVRSGCDEAFEAGTPFANARLIALARNHLPALLAENTRMREALEPFAKAADIKLCGEWRDDQSIQPTDTAWHVKFGDLRRARAALGATHEQ